MCWCVHKPVCLCCLSSQCVCGVCAQVQQIGRVVEVVEETLQGRSVQLYGQTKREGKKLGGAPLNMPKIRKNPLIEIIPVSTGLVLHTVTQCVINVSYLY